MVNAGECFPSLPWLSNSKFSNNHNEENEISSQYVSFVHIETIALSINNSLNQTHDQKWFHTFISTSSPPRPLLPHPPCMQLRKGWVTSLLPIECTADENYPLCLR